jgi:hypothetical protein
MKNRFFKICNTYYLAISLLLGLIACDGGLYPPEPAQKAFVAGTITYKNGKSDWPPADSVIELRLVGFRNYPPGDILSELTKGNAFFTQDTLPRFVDSSSFSLEISKPPVELKYIAVAQRYGSILQWKAIGVFTLTGDNTIPSPLIVKPGDNIRNINIIVDFKNLPPQPFN